MNSSSFIAVLTSICLLSLAGCGEPTVESLRTGFKKMSDERLLVEVERLNGECRKSRTESDKPSSPCNQRTLAEQAASEKGWCWGPHAAANSDKSWLRCEDDATRDERASRDWYSLTTKGDCRELMLQEAIGSVVAHDGPWNVKTAFTSEGLLDVSSRQKNGDVVTIRLYPNCGAALLVYITHPERPNGLSVAVPLGFSLKTAGDYYGFDMRSCSGYSFGNGFGCMHGFEQGGMPPILLSDGFTPCRVGGPIQYDFALRTGMAGVTCSASEASYKEFNQKMEDAFGAAKVDSDGDKLWTFGRYSARSVEYVLLGQIMRKVSFFQTGG